MIKLSIITPSYNQGQYIEENIISVLNQNYSNYEHIIIDGGSTDNTVDILKKYSHLKWVSEKDNGQADALNKGLKIATGDIIGWINSDDYYEENIFASVVSNFSDEQVDWVVGNLTRLLENKKLFVPDKSKKVTYEALLRDPDIVRQQATFFRHSALNAVGGFNPTFHLVMDLDLWLRMAKISSPLMVNANWAYFRLHEAQKTVVRCIMTQIEEIKLLYMRENYTSLRKYEYFMRKYLIIFRANIKRQLTVK